MRCVAGAGLLALVGCNQIFGIAQTSAFDASIDVVVDQPHVTLDWQIAGVDPATGGPSQVPTFAPIAPAPAVRIAPLHATAGDATSPLGAWLAASYTGNGAIEIPRDYLTQPWRLEYKLADGIPHEVQWQPDDKVGHIAVPIFGRLERVQPPSGAGYTITPMGAPGSYTYPRVFTTGTWTEGIVTKPPVGSTLDYDFSSSVSLSGPLGQPNKALGDRALLVDFFIDPMTSCRTGKGSAELDPTLMGTHSALTPQWDASQTAITSGVVDPARLGTGLGNLESSFNAMSSFLLFGALANGSLPGLSATAQAPLLTALLPVPVMITLAQCAYNMKPAPTTMPAVLGPFPKILHIQLVDTRSALGATLVSGMETVIPQGANGTFAIAFPAPFAQQITLTTPTKGAIALDGTADQLDIGPASGVLALSFAPEPVAGLRADYYDVILHRIVGGSLATERIYTIPTPQDSAVKPSVLIDGALLTPGVDYALEIRSFKGHPQAPHGDFAPVDYPYGSAIVLARTFKAS